MVAHFRGRKLLGQTVNLPEGYHGAAVCVTDAPLAEHNHYNNNEEDSNTKVAQQVAEFDKFVIWKHDNLPNATEDAYIKGIDEWMQLAELIHAP
jgi:ribonuclease H2 subunit C